MEKRQQEGKRDGAPSIEQNPQGTPGSVGHYAGWCRRRSLEMNKALILPDIKVPAPKGEKKGIPSR